MANPQRHGIGVLGLGVMGREMVAAMAAHPRFRVVGAYDPRPPRDGAVAIAASAQALATDAAVGCLYIASPPALHAAGVALATRNAKAVLCEKPLAPTPSEAEAMCRQVAAAGRPAAVNFYFAAAEAAVRQRHLVASGALGEVRTARLTLRFKTWPRPWQAAAGAWLSSPGEGGFVREVGSHFLFQAGRLFGTGRCAEAAVRRGAAGTEVAVTARIDYPGVVLEIDGVIGGDRDDHNRLEIVGTKGSAALVDWERLDWSGPDRGSWPETPGMLDSLAAMLDGRPHTLATFAEAAAVVGLTEAILAG
jgi:predicted dehydrogenase